MVVGATLVSGAAAPRVMFARAAIIFVIACSALFKTPGQHGPGGG
jgi:hypothetical protein